MCIASHHMHMPKDKQPVLDPAQAFFLAVIGKWTCCLEAQAANLCIWDYFCLALWNTQP